jgi:hypothetical protein
MCLHGFTWNPDMTAVNSFCDINSFKLLNLHY